MSTIKNPRKPWLATGNLLSLVEDAISGAEIATAPCLPALAIAHLPFCLWGGRAHMAASLFSFGIPSIICSVVEPGITVWLWSLLQERIFFFFLPLFVSLAMSRFGLLSHISSLQAGGATSRPHAGGQGWRPGGPTPCLRPGTVAGRTKLMSKEPWLCGCRRA